MKNLAYVKNQFMLNPDITYLNFGSFGACVKPVFNELIRLQTLLEFEPVQFITVNGPQYLAASRKALAKFINCDMDDVVYVPNPSFAVNLVAKNLNLKADDEILTTNLEYGACDKTWEFYCNEVGAKYIRQPITLPLTDKQTFVNEFFKGLTPNTRLIFISHITSTTALKFPVDAICAKAKELGLLTFVDGAHAPGHVAIDLGLLKADFYTGACHKWMMTPKGSSFLYADKKLQAMLNPLIVSWGYNSNIVSSSMFLDYHQFNGTRDFSAYLTIPTAIAFMQQNNWDEIAMYCHKLVIENAKRFCALFETAPLSPLNNSFIGQMFSIPVNTNKPVELQQHLFNDFNIEIPVMSIDGKTYIRYSIQAFNTQNDLDKLYNALVNIKQKGMFLLQ